jgi:hypothetical protein
MTEHLNLRRWLCVLPLLLCGMGACAGKAGPGEATGGTSSGGFTALGGSTATGGSPGSEKSCTQEADCIWTEMGVEILEPADCMCLYGCPYILVNRATADRRAQQYAANCNSTHNGKGEMCGIDDCAMPPGVLCLDGTCTERK